MCFLINPSTEEQNNIVG